MMRSFAKFVSAAVVAAGLLAGPVPAFAADVATYQSLDQVSGRVVRLALNKSMVVNLTDDVKDVMVSNPAVADAVIRTNRKIYIIGMAAGETNVFLFGDGGRQIAQFELVISRDTLGSRAPSPA